MPLPDAVSIAYVHLKISDLKRSLAFYRDALGMQVLSETPQSAQLAARSNLPVQVILEAVPNAQPRPQRSTGLYHAAIRVSSRAALARLFYRLAALGIPFQGFADHQVSEAIYLADPDGNGLELYRDRPRAEWRRQGTMVEMSTDPLDVNALLREGEHAYDTWDGIDPDADIGHVHLQVGSLKRAEQFYVDALGMEVMQRGYPGALFVAAGGYHHHLGLNVWAGQNLPPTPDQAVGLHAFAIHIPTLSAWQAAIERLTTQGFTVETPHIGEHTSVTVRDSDQLRVILIAPTASTH